MLLVADSCPFVQFAWTHVPAGGKLGRCAARIPDHTRSARRSAARAVHVGHLLLPVRADRSLGAGPASRARVDVVPRRQHRALLARGRRRRASAAAARRLLLGAARPRSPPAQRAWRTGPAGRRPGIRLRQRPLCDPAPRRRWTADQPRVRHRALRTPGSTQPGRAAASHHRHRSGAGVAVAGNRRMHTTLRLIAAEGSQLRPGGEAVITRPSDILVIQAVRVDRRRRGGADRLAGSPAGSPHRPGHVARAPRSGPALVGGLAGASDQHVVVGVRRPIHRAGGRASDAVRHPVADAGGARLAADRRRPRCGARCPLGLRVRGGLQPRL